MSHQTQPAKQRKLPPVLFFLRVIQGGLIGGGAILPGVSGGVLAVVFGIYRPMMAFFARPFRTLKAQYRLFIPIIIGVGLGFWGFAKLVDWMFSGDSPLPISLFVGLILGTVPMLYRSAQKPRDGISLTDKEKRHNRTALALSFVGLLIFLILIASLTRLSLAPTVFWSLVSGIIWGFSLVVPGLSSSSILLFMGIYDKIMSGVGDLNFPVILPLLLGIALVAGVFARLVDRLFERHYGIASNAVVGLVLASTLMIIPRTYSGLGEGLLCLMVAAAGFVAAHFLGVWGEKVKPAE